MSLAQGNNTPTWPRIEPGSPNPESDALTTRPVRPPGNRWCKRESVECNALKEWKLSIFNIVDKRIKFNSHNTNLLPPNSKSSFRHLKQGIQEFHRKYVLVSVDKAANNIVVVCR